MPILEGGVIRFDGDDVAAWEVQGGEGGDHGGGEHDAGPTGESTSSPSDDANASEATA